MASRWRKPSTDRTGDYHSLVRISVTTEKGTRSVAGTLIGTGKPRLVEIKGIKVEADFAAHMLYVTNKDKPGFIGKFGMILAEAGVNIATFHLGRAAEGGDAICLVSTDGETPDAVLQTVRALPLVMQATNPAF